MIKFAEPYATDINIPNYRWRIPACCVGFVDTVYSSTYLYLIINWLYEEHQHRYDTEWPHDRTWLLLGIIGASIYIPFSLLAVYYSCGLIAVTLKKPNGGVGENYTAVDEAENTLRFILHWRYYNSTSLVLGLIKVVLCIIFPHDWVMPLVHCAVLFVLLISVHPHIREIRNFIRLQERREKMSIRRKSKALINALQFVNET